MKALAVLVAAAAVCLLLAASADAAVINVNTTADLPGPGCPDGGGNCSLRQALALANGNADSSNTINIPASVSDYALPNGVLTISKTVTLQGGGAGGTVIRGNGASRVFIVTAGSSDPVEIDGVTITGGAVTGNTGLVGGGGIYDNSSSPLTLRGTVVSGNSVNANGGGCCNGGGGVWATNDLALIDSSLTGNTVTVTAGSFCCNGGGGLFQDGGAITLTRSTVSGNTVTVTGGTCCEGGGGFFEDGGAITLTNSHVDGNSASITGSVQNSGGGGVYQDGGANTLTDSTVDRNTASVSGAQGFNGGGGFYNDGGALTLTRTTVGANIATVSGTSDNGGGGIYHDGGTPTITDSTLSANSLTVSGTTLNGGGAIWLDSAGGAWLGDTVAGNSANAPGGGILSAGSADTYENTIVGNNSAPSDTNCTPGTAFTSLGGNIDSSTGCNFTSSADKSNTNPLLGPLQDNGGPAPTQMPLAGSPAIDAAVGSACSATDERGQARPHPNGCDIGAVEVAAPSATTGAASAVQPTSATLAGAAGNPDTVAGGNVFFQFGTGTAYGSQTAAQPLAAGASGAGFAASASGLKPHTLYHFRAVATTPDGTAVGADQTFTTTRAARPSITHLGISPKSFRALPGRGASIAAKPALGARVSYRDSQASTTKFTIQRPARGFRSGKRCVARRPHGHGKVRRCTFYRALGSFSHHDRAGSNRFRFTGRVKRRPLKPGRYRLRAVARNSSTGAGKAVTTSFRIVR